MTKRSVVEIAPVKHKRKVGPWIARNWRHREHLQALAAKKKKRARKQ